MSVVYPGKLQTPFITVCCYAYAIEPLTVMSVASVLGLWADGDPYRGLEFLELHLSPAQAYQLRVDTNPFGTIIIEPDYPQTCVEIWKDGVLRVRFESVAVPMKFVEAA